MRIMIVVTHLLGTGHLARALTLGRAFGHAGHDVHVVSGGAPVPHFDTAGLTLTQLPPLRSDGVDFARLLHPDGRAASADDLAQRTAALLHHLHNVRPDVLITELFPFGRRIMRDEFGALLHAAREVCPLILASVRDILAPPSKPSKAAFADDMVAHFYDGVLVHADAEVVTLDASWPVSADLAPKLRYTGFVAPSAPNPVSEPRNDTVLVSAGGGSVGAAIFDTALAAARLHTHTTWHLLVGGSPERRANLRAAATENVIVEAPRPDFRTLLSRAAASVSMCGYNTALDLLQTGVPAVMVPFDDGGEVEQMLRAKALAALPAMWVLPQADLTPERLCAALNSVTGRTRTPRRDGMNGAAETVRMVEAMVAEATV
ncbi:glycosyltransferase family protein [Tateyamaria sp. SN6-1]|uniref:glycosyltransferase family protein n=1 Tax=Tateyamaria sp. SN6-1 TaxID=3092148 RepID=UPI0039F63E60